MFQNNYTILKDDNKDNETDRKHMKIVLKCIKLTFLIDHLSPK